jgi:hypothetical protein
MGEAQPPSDALARPLRPNFQNIRGAMHRYSQRTNAPTAENINAFYEELLSGMEYVTRDPNVTWEDVLSGIENGVRFWSQYYCGRERKGE